jgi:uncharacterized protein (UPF0305 family)
MVKLHNDDIMLIRDFIIREAKDYKPIKNGIWIRYVVHQILEKLKEIENGNYLKIVSVGNPGATIRELKMCIMRETTQQRFNYIITLCTCGELNHMVHIRKEKI